MSREQQRIRTRFDELLDAPTVPFPAVRGQINAPNEHGVYVIRDIRGNVLHVGRTISGQRGLWRRLRDHLRGRSSFSLLYALPRHIRLRETCCFQYVRVPNPRERALLEALAVGELCPKHVGVGLGVRPDEA